MKLRVPSSLEEITTGQYQEFIKVQQNSNDNEFIAQKMISIFCGIPMKDVINIEYNSVVDLTNHFTSLFSEEPEFKTRIEFNGIDLGFIPNLEKISMGEYIDLEEGLKDWSTYHKALSVMYRPVELKVGDKYEIRKYDGSEDFHELFKELPVSVALSATIFFCRLGIELSKAILTSSTQTQETQKKTSQAEGNSQETGDGINQYTQSQKEIYYALTKSLEWEYTRPLHSFHLKSKSK
jgi:hypothetical protein